LNNCATITRRDKRKTSLIIRLLDWLNTGID
jgi:hypothetical protein